MGLFIAGADLGGRLASLDMLDLILQASLIVKLVLLLLAAFSVISWTIIAFKWRELRRAAQDSEAFLEVYRTEPFAAAYEAARHLDRSPLAVVFLAACSELPRAGSGVGQVPHEGERSRAVRRRIAWTASEETRHLERGLSFLATTGSSAPFIGLFGTVVGIIGAFQGIGRAGSASLAIVAPGIAEALIATAVGLLAAIPATIFYNYFAGKIDDVAASVDIFQAELDVDLGQPAPQTPQVQRAVPRASGQ